MWLSSGPLAKLLTWEPKPRRIQSRLQVDAAISRSRTCTTAWPWGEVRSLTAVVQITDLRGITNSYPNSETSAEVPWVREGGLPHELPGGGLALSMSLSPCVIFSVCFFSSFSIFKNVYIFSLPLSLLPSPCLPYFPSRPPLPLSMCVFGVHLEARSSGAGATGIESHLTNSEPIWSL